MLPPGQGPPLTCALIAASDGQTGRASRRMNAVCPLGQVTHHLRHGICGLSSISFQVRLSPAHGAGCGALSSGSEPCSWTQSPASLPQRLWGHLWLAVHPSCVVSSLGYLLQSAGLVGHVSLSLSVPTLLTRPADSQANPGFGNQTESCSDPQPRHSYRLGDLRHVTAPFKALVSPVA